MKKLKAEEVISYGLAGFGQNMVYALSSFFLMFFYTEVFCVSPITVGTLFLVARIWDALNDFIMGVIVDRTNTRWGKFRPYLLISPIPIAILTILTFSAPDITGNLKLVYISVTYILWGMFYTISDVPYWSLSASITNDTKERTLLISITRVLTMFGMSIPIVLVPIMVESLGNGSLKNGYLLTSIIISTIGCILLSLAFFGTKEKVQHHNDKTSLINNIKLLFKNKPLLIVLLASLFGFTRNMAQSAGTYVAKYNLGDEGLYSLLGGTLICGVIVAIVITPVLTIFFTKKRIFIFTSIIGGIFYIVMYFVGYDNLILLLISIFISSLSMGFFTVLQTAMIADSIDYLEWKTGVRAEGICFSGQTFFAKLNSALTSFVMGLVLELTGYIENSLVQNENVINGIFSLVTIIPGIGCLLSVIPMLFYNFTESKQKKCINEINLRKN